MRPRSWIDPVGASTVSGVNAELVHWLNQSGLSKKEFARRVQARAHAHGHVHVSTAASRVRGWLAGQQPAEAATADAVAEVLSEACGRPLTAEDLGFRHAGPHASPGPDLRLAVIPHCGEALARHTRADLIRCAYDLRAEHVDIADGEALLEVAEHIALGRPATLPDPHAGKRIDRIHVAQIAAAIEVFRRWDNEFGGGLRRKAVVGQLSDVAGLLGGPFHSEPVGRQLYSAVADLAQLAGWMSYDLQLHATAQRYFLLGMHLAKDAGDRPQVARMLYCLARQMIDLNHPREALDLAQTGVYAIRRASTPKTMAMLQIIEARAHACMGAPVECQRALDQAQETFAQAGTDTDPAWCAFFGVGELYGLIGVALRDLAIADAEHARIYAERARPWIQRAIEHRPGHYVRSRVMDIDALAAVSALLGDAEATAAATTTAISMAGAVTSARVTTRLRRTAQLARQRFPGSGAMNELSERVRALPRGELPICKAGRHGVDGGLRAPLVYRSMAGRADSGC